jgi:predicted helicase
VRIIPPLTNGKSISVAPSPLTGEGWGEGDSNQLETITPEEILGYIYAKLHSPSYRKRYLEFLKIYFPRIPFDVTLQEFKRLSSIGSELIKAHLMQTIPNYNIGEPLREDNTEKNYTVDKIRYDESKERLYFNKHCYFDKVSPEVFNFKIDGYQVIDKYLESRKGIDIGKNLGYITSVIKILAFTVEKQGLI